MVSAPSVVSMMPTWLKNLWHTQRLWALLAIAVLVVAVGVALFWPVTDLIAAHDVGRIPSPQRAAHLQTARDAARGRLLQLGAGLFAAAALVYTARNFTLSRTGQVTDRYTKAIEQLGSKKLDVRIGAIYALGRIAHDSAADRPTVMEVLAAFIREHSHEQWPLPAPDSDVAERATRPDVQAAITVIWRRDDRCGDDEIDLTRADLTRADLTRANLLGLILTGANLTGARLFFADLTGALFTGANLTGAHLTNVLYPKGTTVPEGWVRDSDSDRLKRANGHLSSAAVQSEHALSLTVKSTCRSA